ncbi:MAG: protein translocase subunit SecF [Patescibacteria group bacterium]|nr:protein translocase subunit SecF [Patescibacteria group bacterium]
MYQFIEKKKFWYSFSAGLCFLSVLALVVWGLKLGIDFTGGSLLEVSYSKERPSIQLVQESLAELGLESLLIQPSGDREYILRFEDVDDASHQEVLEKLNTLAQVVDPENKFSELRFEAIGPIIGKELKSKSLQSIILVLIFIVAYIAYAFRKVSKPVSAWKYGLTAIIALVHDILIITGIFAALGYFLGIEINTLFVTALLTIMGFSVHDTIVTFDRTRENLFKNQDKDFSEIVNISIHQTLLRSINTSVSTLLVLLAIYFLGGESIKNFILALILGIVVGTYSSIFLASPMLTSWHKKS